MDLYQVRGQRADGGDDQTGTNASMDYMDQYEAILEQTVAPVQGDPAAAPRRYRRNPPQTPDGKRSLGLKGHSVWVRNCQTSRQRSIWSRP